MGRCGRSRAWEVVMIAQREREREEIVGFAPMTLYGGGGVEMAT
jgi:hypothetical protein